jgi:tetratricopeptide (TPR) repeat protein
MSLHGDYYPGDADQYLVQTPYGKGLFTRTRPNTYENSPPIKEIRLLEWEKAAKEGKLYSKHHTKLYSIQDYPSVEPQKGDDVQTPYGRGHIIETVTVRILSRNLVLHKYHVVLDSWRLAGRSRVKCYLFSNQVKTLRKKTLAEMNAVERVEFAMRQKSAATAIFAEKKYRQALNIYAGCIDAVRYVQHDNNNNNECRADLIEVMVTCSNNAATCCVQLKMWEEAFKFAKNAIILLNALYDKRGMKIHTILNQDGGHCDTQLFGEWRVKSRFVMARSLFEKDEYEAALEEIKEAREHIAYYVAGEGCDDSPPAKESVKRLRGIEKQIASLRANVVAKRKEILQKEKARARAMFSDEKPKDCEITSDAQPAVRVSNEENEASIGNGSESKKNPLKKKVSFATALEETREIPGEEEEEEEQSWYEEHKEAILLLTIGGIMAMSFFFGMRKRKL